MGNQTPVEVFERHHLRVYRFLYRMTADPSLAEDLTQEVFVRVLAGLDGYEARGREASWVFRIARNLLKDARKRERRSPSRVDETSAHAIMTRADVTLGYDLAEALSQVPTEEREALLLREYGGFGYEEISAMTGASPAAIRSRIFRARRTLRTLLAPTGASR